MPTSDWLAEIKKLLDEKDSKSTKKEGRMMFEDYLPEKSLPIHQIARTCFGSRARLHSVHSALHGMYPGSQELLCRGE